MNIQDLINTVLASPIASKIGILAILSLVVIAIWSLVWKALALWKAARKHHVVWFIIFLLVNTVGILEILYIFWFSKIGQSKPKPIAKQVRRRRR